MGFRRFLFRSVFLSFCLSCSGIISFLFDKPGVRQFLPALGAFFVFGVLVGLVPRLDWPLRTVAARYAGNLLAVLGAKVDLASVAGKPTELVLAVGKRAY